MIEGFWKHPLEFLEAALRAEAPFETAREGNVVGRRFDVIDELVHGTLAESASQATAVKQVIAVSCDDDATRSPLFLLPTAAPVTVCELVRVAFYVP